MRYLIIFLFYFFSSLSFAEESYFIGNIKSTHKKFAKVSSNPVALKTTKIANTLKLEMTYQNEGNSVLVVKNEFVTKDDKVKFVSFKKDGEPYSVDVIKDAKGDLEKYRFTRFTPETETVSAMVVKKERLWKMKHVQTIKEHNYVIEMDIDLKITDKKTFELKIKEISSKK